MKYDIQITSSAERDIMHATDYIEFALKNKSTAENLLALTEKKLHSLSEMPDRFHIVDDPVLSSWKIRFISINNYLAFYTIDDKNKVVIVVRFLYKKSNWSAVLGGEA